MDIRKEKQIRNVVFRETRPVYTSVVRKLEREFARNYNFLHDPFLDERDHPFWRRIKGQVGFKILKRVIEPTLALHGWTATLEARDDNHLLHGRHITVSVDIKGTDMAFTVTVVLPVLKTPVWCPRRYGGVWSIVELHELSDAWHTVQNLLRELGSFINDNMPEELRASVVPPSFTGTMPILLTPHVCRITRTPYNGDLTRFLRAQKEGSFERTASTSKGGALRPYSNFPHRWG